VAEIPSNKRKSEQHHRIRERFRLQNGFITRQQLLALGLTPSAVDGRLRSGRYVAVHSGVYSEGVPRRDPVGRATAAVLACGSEAVLSHGSAASLWGFHALWADTLEVTTTVRRTRPGITVYRCRSLEPRDITRHWEIPVTTPARTVLDIAPSLTAKQLTRLVNDARLSRYLLIDALVDVLDRNPYDRGTRLLRPFAEDPANPTRSGFEDDFRAFCAAYDLPTPQINVKVHGFEVDALFPEQNLIVEADGWETHRDRSSFESDRDRDAELLRHGFRTVRLTRDRLLGKPGREAQRLLEILDRS
jgi:Protein of unknown function (DUF559)